MLLNSIYVKATCNRLIEGMEQDDTELDMKKRFKTLEDKVKKYAREYVVNLWLKEVDIQPIVDKLTYKMIDY